MGSRSSTTARRRRRSATVNRGFIEVKHVYHPETGQLLGVFAATEIPSDPTKLAEFARQKAKAGGPPTNNMAAITGDPDGWDRLRQRAFWVNVRDHDFWERLSGEFEKIATGMAADANGIHDPLRHGSAALMESHFSRDRFTRLAWIAVDKLRQFGLQSSSDFVDVWLGMLQENPEISGTTVSTSRRKRRPVQVTENRYVKCVRTASLALCSALATQAVKNQLIRDEAQIGPADIRAARAETVAKLIEELNVLKPQMLEDESEYEILQRKYPAYLAFKIAKDRPDLKTKILFIRGSARHIRLAQELAAAHYGLGWRTIADVWKGFKPTRYKRARKLDSPHKSRKRDPKSR